LRRSPGSSSPCSAISASIPPTVRSVTGAELARAASPSLGAKPLPAMRRAAGVVTAVMLAFGPVMRMGRGLCVYPEFRCNLAGHG